MGELTLRDGASRQAAGAYLARLVRLDPSALVRLRPTPAGAVEVWAMLPFGVLVTRAVLAAVDQDVTVLAADLLAAVGRADGPERWQVAMPRRRDLDWRWSLPSGSGQEVERLLAADVRQVSAAAAATVSEVGATGLAGRAVGQRALRDALLDHVPFVITQDTAAGGGDTVAVPQRLVQAVMRMGFVADDDATVGVSTTERRSVGCGCRTT